MPDDLAVERRVKRTALAKVKSVAVGETEAEMAKEISVDADKIVPAEIERIAAENAQANTITAEKDKDETEIERTAAKKSENESGCRHRQNCC